MTSKDHQIRILFDLLSWAERTVYGRQYRFDEIKSYPEFRNRLPIRFYEDIEDEVEQMKAGVRDLLWPGRIHRFAVSAGTTGAGKHLPLSNERIKSDGRFMRSVCRSYISQRPNLFHLLGRHLSLPGSVERRGEILIGEISGFTARQAPWWIRPFQLESPRRLTRLPFHEKFERILHASADANIKVIVAVPSWILTLFQQVLRKTGRHTIAEVWPNLKLLICGGVKLANYRPYLEKLTGSLNPDFIETYGASEGYFAYTDDLLQDDLGLVCDNNIFYEFVPDPLPDPESLSIQQPVPLWKVESSVPYAMLVTTNSGLWRYAVNDIVEFTSTRPPRIKVKGRLSEMLDDFGEGLYLHEAEAVLNGATDRVGLEKGCFTIGGFIESEDEPPRHYWFVQFFEPVHSDTLKRMGETIDLQLQKINRHYAIRRESGAMAPPVIRSITQSDINDWFSYNGKEKAQSKLPKSLDTREDIEFFLRR